MTNPGIALLWECWRLSRYGIAIRLSIGLIFSLSALAGFDTWNNGENRETGMLVVALATSMACAFSALELGISINGGKGFPFQLGFARPISTRMLVLIPMCYFSSVCMALYLLPIIVLRIVFDLPFPLIPISILITVFAFALIACNWWTPYRPRQYIGFIIVYFGATALFYQQIDGGVADFNPASIWATPVEHWPEFFEFSTSTYALILIAIATAMMVTIVGAEHQRRGDDVVGFGSSDHGASRGNPAQGLEWFTALYKVACPTSSPLLAELWLELKCRAVPVLGIGVSVAFLIPLFWLLLNAFGSTGLLMSITEVVIIVLIAMACATFLPLFASGTQTFGIQRKHGTSYIIAFYATRALGTAHLSWLKIIVTSTSILMAWTIMGTSFWLSAHLIEDVYDYQQAKASLTAFIQMTPISQLAASFVVALTQFTTLVVLVVMLQTLYVFNARRVLWSLITFALYATFLTICVTQGSVSIEFFVAHLWLAAVLVLAGIGRVFWIVVEDRIVTPKQIVQAMMLWTAFLVAYIFVLNYRETPGLDLPLIYLAWTLILGLLPLAAVAPWSFSLLRHQ